MGNFGPYPSNPASAFPVLIRDLLMGEKVTQPAYDAGNVYYFLYPQTSLARLQYLYDFREGWNPPVSGKDHTKIP